MISSRFRMGAAALLLAASALLSRLMGLVRDKIISWQFGASHEADMYFAAFVVPDIINYLLAGAFVSITIIPLLARSFKDDENDAWRLFSCILFWMSVASIALTCVGEVFAVRLAALVAPGFSQEQILRLATFMRIILPAQVFFLCGSCFTAILFLRRQFAVPALSPLIYNGCIIAFGLTLPFLPGIGPDFGMKGYCIGVSVGAFLGAFVLPFMIALGGGLKLGFYARHASMRKFMLFALPLMLGQTVVVLDEQFLRIFGSMLSEGSVSLLNYGRRIAQVPVSLMGQAIAVASYPFLVRLLAENDLDKFNRTLNAAIKGALILVIPCAIWMISAIRPILGIIFEGGRFGVEQTNACIPLTQIMLVATPAWIVYMVLARAYYAYEDTITPALTGTIITIIALPCYYWPGVANGAWAIAAISSISLFVYVGWLAIIWLKRHGRAAFDNLGPVCVRMLACSLVPGAISWLFYEDIAPNLHTFGPFFNYCGQLAINVAIFSVIFFPLVWLLMPDFLQTLWRRLNRRRTAG